VPKKLGKPAALVHEFFNRINDDILNFAFFKISSLIVCVCTFHLRVIRAGFATKFVACSKLSKVPASVHQPSSSPTSFRRD
jgi:hypothetical protein